MLNRDGKKIVLTKNGESKQEIENSFLGTGYIPIQITKIEFSNRKKISGRTSRTVLEFTQMMEELIVSGLSIKDSLDVMCVVDDKNKTQGKIAQRLLENIKKGDSFSDAIINMPDYFSDVYCGIINVGNKIGSVEKIFPRLRMYLEMKKKLRDKLISAITYPCLVLFTAIIAFFSMILFVFPKLKTMFAEFGGNAAETLETNISNMQNIFAIIITVILIFVTALFTIKILEKQNSNIKIKSDRIKLHIPFIGHFLSCFETLNFSFAMETLTGGGVSVETAIKEAESVVSNSAYKQSLENVKDRIQKGEALSSAFSKHSIFPIYMTKWILIGERSGNTEQVFSQIRKYFQNKIEQNITKFMSLIEPTLILLIGILLLLLVFTIIVPVFSLYGSIL